MITIPVDSVMAILEEYEHAKTCETAAKHCNDSDCVKWAIRRQALEYVIHLLPVSEPEI